MYRAEWLYTSAMYSSWTSGIWVQVWPQKQSQSTYFLIKNYLVGHRWKLSTHMLGGSGGMLPLIQQPPVWNFLTASLTHLNMEVGYIVSHAVNTYCCSLRSRKVSVPLSHPEVYIYHCYLVNGSMPLDRYSVHFFFEGSTTMLLPVTLCPQVMESGSPVGMVVGACIGTTLLYTMILLVSICALIYWNKKHR